MIPVRHKNSLARKSILWGVGLENTPNNIAVGVDYCPKHVTQEGRTCTTVIVQVDHDAVVEIALGWFAVPGTNLCFSDWEIVEKIFPFRHKKRTLAGSPRFLLVWYVPGSICPLGFDFIQFIDHESRWV